MKYLTYTVAGAALVTAVYLATTNDEERMAPPFGSVPEMNSRAPASTSDSNSGPTTKAPEKKSPNNEAAIASRLKSFKDCADRENCPYPQTDPQSYEFALHHDVANFLKQIPAAEMRDNSSVKRELLDWMKRGNGFVQAEALKHLRTLPPSTESLNAVIEGLENNYHDALIMKQAMQEFSRYPDNPAVATFVQNTLTEGPQLSAVEAAKGIRNVLTPKNVDNYEKLLPQVRSESVREALSASLKDYRYSLAGG